MASFFFLHNSQLQKGFKVTYKNINNTFKTDEEITERKREEHKESQDREMHAIKLTDIYWISTAYLALSSPASKAEKKISSYKIYSSYKSWLFKLQIF